MSSRALLAILLPVTTVLLGLGACERGVDGTSGGGQGQGGEGGCSEVPEALFTLKVLAADGPLPEDTSVQVTWSAGDEPAFELDDPETWHTLEDGNVVCGVDRDAGAPADLDKLVCKLWTSGPTRVVVEAEGYVTRDETFTPKLIAGCDRPVPTDVTIEIARDADAGDG